MKPPLDPDEILDLVAQRTALRLSLLVRDGNWYQDRTEWESELEAVDKQLVELGLLKEVGQAELVTLRGSYTEVGAGSADRPCEFCGGAGERVVDTEIDGFVYEITIDCPH